MHRLVQWSTVRQFLIITGFFEMNVTKSSFSAALDEIITLLPSCVFYSFDEEMTGYNMTLATIHSTNLLG
jgi:hypothetical protein